jgi:hypothetical protein
MSEINCRVERMPRFPLGGTHDWSSKGSLANGEAWGGCLHPASPAPRGRSPSTPPLPAQVSAAPGLYVDEVESLLRGMHLLAPAKPSAKGVGSGFSETL